MPGTTPPLPAAVRRAIVAALLRCLPDGSWYKSRAHQLQMAAPGARSSPAASGTPHSLGYFYVRPDQREPSVRAGDGPDRREL